MSKAKDRDYLRVVGNDTPPAPAKPAEVIVEPAARAITDPPANYDQDHREVWAEIVLQARGTLQAVDRWNLDALVRSIVLHGKASAKVAEYGSVIKSPGGHPIQSPYVADMNKQAEKIRKLSRELGLTPAARDSGNKGKGSKAPAKRGPFADLKSLADD